MRLITCLSASLLSLTVITGCASKSVPEPARSFFSIDPENPARFVYSQEWAQSARPEKGKRDGAATRKRGRNDRSGDQRSEISQQFLAALDEELVQQNLCPQGYRVLDLQRQPGRMTLSGQCR